MSKNLEGMPDLEIPKTPESAPETVDQLLNKQQVEDVVDRVIKLLSKKAEASVDLDIQQGKMGSNGKLISLFS